jgi:general secretion pathway protein A
MSYYQALGLLREPFSNSPDPDMLYRSRTHLECLQHMEIAVRLRRGLNVVLGAVGAGKTTLARELTRLLSQDGDVEALLLDDPACASTTDFLLSILRLFGLDPAALWRDPLILKEVVKAELLRRSDEGRRIVALIVDEGQKITPECLELLRELLNFETNTHKLLQIVIFAQTEFEDTLLARPNLDDRVNYRYRLEALSRLETRRMIETRLALCAPEGEIGEVFTNAALRRIHRRTGGHPRKIVRLCHLSMLLAVGFGKPRVTWWLVGRAERKNQAPSRVWLPRLAAAGMACAGLALVLQFAGPGLPEASRAALAWLGETVAAAPTGAGVRSELALPVSGPAAGPAEAKAGASPAEAQSLVTAHPRPMAEAAAQTPEGPGRVAASAPTLYAPSPTPAALEGLGASLALAAAAMPAEPVRPAPAATMVPAASVASSQGQAPQAALPEILGQSVVRQGWAVTRQAARVYGNGGRAVMARLAKANPGIDFDRVRAGETIVFPAIQASALPDGTCLVRLRSVASLDEGFAFIGRHAGGDMTLSLYCVHVPGAGMRFDVVLAALYVGRAAAQAALAELPRELAVGCEVVEGYPAGTVAFTDLGPWPGLRGNPKTATAPRQVASSEAADRGERP